jgi:hypothetical protein
MLDTQRRLSVLDKLSTSLIVLLIAAFCSLDRADEVLDDLMTTPAMAVTIKTLGIFACSGRLSVKDVEHNKTEFKKNFWAFEPDVKLSDQEVAEQEKFFDQMWDSVYAVSAEYNVNQVSFIGCDTVLLSQCVDMYYAAFTTKGPVLFKFSVEFKVNEHARLFNAQTYTKWDQIKEIVRGIQHQVSLTRVPVLTVDQKSSSSTTSPNLP